MSKGKIPDRWIPYEPCGDVIEGTRIICFKVPLHKNVQQRVRGITKIWDIPAVLEEIPMLGAVIDLTNTARYYDPQEFEAAKVTHRKILMPGRELPPDSKVREFMDAVDEFLSKDSESLVGVHCTHGLNRTGYMVCRYMIDRLNIPAEDAIQRFEKARGYEIERENYKADLLNKKPPPPDLGKRTVIKPLNKQTDDGYDDYANDRNCCYGGYGSNSWNYASVTYRSDRYSGDGYNTNGLDRNRDDGYLSWRNRNDGSSSSNAQNSRSSRQRNDSKSSSSRSYSYAHDY